MTSGGNRTYKGLSVYSNVFGRLPLRAPVSATQRFVTHHAARRAVAIVTPVSGSFRSVLAAAWNGTGASAPGRFHLALCSTGDLERG